MFKGFVLLMGWWWLVGGGAGRSRLRPGVTCSRTSYRWWRWAGGCVVLRGFVLSGSVLLLGVCAVLVECGSSQDGLVLRPPKHTTCPSLPAVHRLPPTHSPHRPSSTSPSLCPNTHAHTDTPLPYFVSLYTPAGRQGADHQPRQPQAPQRALQQHPSRV